MTRAPLLPHDAARAVTDQLARALQIRPLIKSFDAAADAQRLELDVSLPIRALGPSPSRTWDPAVDVSLQSSRTQYWHHQVRILNAIERYATSRFITDNGIGPTIVSISQHSSLAQRIDTMVTIIDHDVPDDAYLASLLKVPTHAVLAILLSNEQQESELFVVTAPRSFDRVHPGKRYRSSGEFLEDLNRERAGGGYRPSQGASKP